MAKTYTVKRGNDHDVRQQLGAYLDDLSDRIGGPDDPVEPYLPAMRKGTADMAWVPGTYYDGDTVTDEGFLMVANKETDDRPAPQPTGTPTWTIPDAPTWTPQQYTGVVYTGLAVTVPDDNIYSVLALRAWIPNVTADANYRVSVYDPGTDIWEYGTPFRGTVLSTPGWYSANMRSNAFTEGEQIIVVLESFNSAATSDFDYPWTYQGIDNNNDPTAGGFNRNTQQTTLRISRIDGNVQARGAELDSVIPGTTIRTEVQGSPNVYWEYLVNSNIADVNTNVFGVSLVNTGLLGGPSNLDFCDVYFSVPVPSPTDYVELANEYTPYPNIAGYIAFDAVEGGVFGDTAYGMDAQWQQYTASDDWDVAAQSDSSGSGVTGDTGFSGGLNLAGTWDSLRIVQTEVFWSRWPASGIENLAKAMNKTLWSGGPPPTWEEVFRIGQFVRYTSQYLINLNDPYIVSEMAYLVAEDVITQPQADIILA